MRHVGVVSDRWACGTPRVIHRSKRRGLAVEERWEEFANGPVYLARHAPRGVSGGQVVARARALIGTEWRPLTQNCEHFVAVARGEVVRSGQVRTQVVLGALVAGVGFAAAHSVGLA